MDSSEQAPVPRGHDRAVRPARLLGGIILAGGRSRRMGRDKALLPVGGVPMVERVAAALRAVCAETWLVCADARPYAFLGLAAVPDAFPGRGALAGLHAGLRACRQPYAAVVACDLPFLRPEVVRLLGALAAGWDAAVPAGLGPASSGGWEPLCAVYGRSCLPAVEAHLAAGDSRMTCFYPDVRVRPVGRAALEAVDPDLRSLLNANTPADYDAACGMAAEEPDGADT